jgi:hypothetical protein
LKGAGSSTKAVSAYPARRLGWQQQPSSEA